MSGESQRSRYAVLPKCRLAEPSDCVPAISFNNSTTPGRLRRILFDEHNAQWLHTHNESKLQNQRWRRICDSSACLLPREPHDRICEWSRVAFILPSTYILDSQYVDSLFRRNLPTYLLSMRIAPPALRSRRRERG